MTAQNRSANEGILTSSVRCHGVCAILAAVLLSASVWVWRNAQSFSQTSSLSEQQIQYSLKLLAEKNNLQTQYQHLLQREKNNQLKRQQINGWLPTQVVWPKAKKRISNLASQSGLQLLLAEKDKIHNGKRVSVMSVNLMGRGSYQEICRFLDLLHQGDQPLWCSAIRIERTEIEDDDTVRCEARISLRLPFAGSGTIAGKLASMEEHRAS